MSEFTSIRRDGDKQTIHSLIAVVPVFTADLDSIKFFYDNNGVIYESIDELLNADATNYYIIEYDMFWRCFEKWYQDHNFEVKFTEGNYTGSPTKYNYIVPNIMTKAFTVGNVAPRINKARGLYNGKKFRFFDYCQFIRGVNSFNIDLEKLEEGAAVLEEVEKLAQVAKNKGYYPNSLAGLARELFGNPSKMNSPERAKYCLSIRAAYKGGLYYLKDKLKRFKIIYDYDIRSLYPYLLTTQMFPDPKALPLLKDGFVEVNNRDALAIYHIRRLNATRKPGVPFNTVFTILEEQDRLLKFGFSISTDGNIKSRENLPLIEGWFTSIDLQILQRDYDIQELDIDYTYYIDQLIHGSKLFGALSTYFKKKEESTGTRRTVYKVLIDSYSGSLGSIWTGSFKISSLDVENRKIFPKKAVNPSPVDIAAFLTAYGRLYITELAKLCEPGTIQSIDTDGIFTTAPAPKLDAICGNNLGDIRLDKIMYDAVWFGNKQYESREDSPTADFTPHIAGLPAYLYEHGRKEFKVPKYLYDLHHNRFVYEETDFPLMLEDEEITDESNI